MDSSRELRYHFMYKMKDAHGETLIQMMDFKGARTVRFRLSDLEHADEELKRDTEAQMDKIKNHPFYTGEKTKHYKDCKSPFSNE